MWKLYDDSTGKVIRKAHGEKEIKIAYVMAIDNGEVLEMDAFIEDNEGRQYAYNRNVTPNRWEEI